MADDLTKRRPQDVLRINRHEPWEVNWWTHEFGVSKQQLFAAIDAVGVMAKDVAKHLGKRQPA